MAYRVVQPYGRRPEDNLDRDPLQTLEHATEQLPPDSSHADGHHAMRRGETFAAASLDDYRAQLGDSKRTQPSWTN